MSDGKRTPVQQLDSLIEAYLADLAEMPDDLLLEKDAASDHAIPFEEVIKAAKGEAGKRRLKEARRALNRRIDSAQVTETVDVIEARRYLSEAANDNRITLAARDLREVPDEEVRRLYLQLKELEQRARAAKKVE